MDKVLEQYLPHQSPLCYDDEEEIPPSGLPAVKKAKIFSNLKQAIDDFDRVDEESVSEYILPLAAIPPVPSPKEEEHHLLQNALLLIDSGEYSLARKILGQILRRNNHAPDAIRWMGWCFKQEGDLENARTCYEQLTKLRVTEDDLFELGEIQFELKLDDEALISWTDALGQCTEESSHLFDLHKNIGNVFLRRGDIESAEENYNKALTLRPQSDILQVNLGSLYFQKKEFIKALQHYKNSVELNPYNDRAWCGVALVARELKDSEWAKATLFKALDMNPYNITSLQVLVSWAQADRDWASAIDRVQKFTFEHQDNGNMIYTLAGLFYQQGDFYAADLELTRLEALEPGRADAQELRNLIKASNKNGS
ncbi:unnamed protein product [Sphagnum balticum]